MIEESLTTPVPRDADIAFPGENWFFYWKTSASLWKSKILENAESHRLIVPINWAFHSDTGDTFDFAKLKPETDLKRLVQVAKEAKREIIFLFPLTPMPFLPNGGIPALLARNQAISNSGLARTFVDNELGLNKIFSFYDPRIYQAYHRFARAFGSYLSTSGLTNDVYGLWAGVFDEFGYTSCLHDRGRVFDRAFERFIEAKKAETPELNLTSWQQEESLKKEFEGTIRELYLQAADEGIGPNWEGEKKFFFLGASEQDLFQRSFDVDSKAKYCHDLFMGIEHGIHPSSVLIPSRVKKGVLGKALNDIVIQSLQEGLFPDHVSGDEGHTQFRPLSFFHVYEKSQDAFWNDVHLSSYLDKSYRHTKRVHDLNSFDFSHYEHDESAIYFFDGNGMERNVFKSMLKIFMSGGKVIFNRDGLPLELLKRLEAFFLENSLHVEKINSQTVVHNIVLGEGRLVIFEGARLKEENAERVHQFWERLINTFELIHLRLEDTQGVDFFWMKRDPGTSEMNYEQLRRLSFYNSTSYKKKVKFRHTKPFMLLKIVDEINAKVVSSGQEVEVELMPDSSVSLDFGVYS